MAYLDANHAQAMAIFQGLTAEQWTGKCLTPAGTPITAWKWLRLMIEHEVHHRGQLYMILGRRGVEAPPLYGLTEPQLIERSVSS